MINKAGPFIDGNFDNSMKKMALQLGLATPSQVGLELGKKKGGEMNAVQVKTEYMIPKTPFGSPPLPKPDKSNNLSGQPQQGRPKNSKDSQKRKTKTFSPQTGASLNIWALSAQDKISSILNPTLLEFYDKKNMRSLSSDQYSEAEDTKTKILLSLLPFSEINDQIILDNFANIDNLKLNSLHAQYKIFSKNIQNNLERELTAEEIKFVRAYFYELVYSEETNSIET